MMTMFPILCNNDRGQNRAQRTAASEHENMVKPKILFRCGEGRPGLRRRGHDLSTVLTHSMSNWCHESMPELTQTVRTSESPHADTMTQMLSRTVASGAQIEPVKII